MGDTWTPLRGIISLKRMSDVTSTYRSIIAAELQRLHDENSAKQREEAARREAQRDRTRSLMRLMQLDTRDEAKIALHAENAALYNQRAAILEQICLLQDRYQAEKKRLPSIPDKKERHEILQRAKAVRDRGVMALRHHLTQLEASAPPVVRPGSSSYAGNVSRAATPAAIVSLPDLMVYRQSRRSERVSATEYKQLMDQIRAVKLERQTMLDPYVANLKLARLWDRLHDTARCLENYESACQVMTEKELARIPPEMLEEVLEKQRLRRKQREEAADLLSKFIELALPEDRLKDVAYVDRNTSKTRRLRVLMRSRLPFGIPTASAT
ncbi:hypothetical protein, variant 11 [Phytophthora nicotianae CJ01A1]|nr:hypothetical protein, variant 11 [Phytophthora nicotianae]ETP20456.1 hypothetical protein, variant 11 [Phytophthora nicotianae CJ01A1]